MDDHDPLESVITIAWNAQCTEAERQNGRVIPHVSLRCNLPMISPTPVAEPIFMVEGG
jgi:hypothetical protein